MALTTAIPFQRSKVFSNRSTIAINTGDAAEFSEFFEPLDVKVDAKHLRKQKLIKVAAEQGTTITSVQLVTYR